MTLSDNLIIKIEIFMCDKVMFRNQNIFTTSKNSKQHKHFMHKKILLMFMKIELSKQQSLLDHTYFNGASSPHKFPQ